MFTVVVVEAWICFSKCNLQDPEAIQVILKLIKINDDNISSILS